MCHSWERITLPFLWVTHGKNRNTWKKCCMIKNLVITIEWYYMYSDMAVVINACWYSAFSNPTKIINISAPKWRKQHLYHQSVYTLFTHQKQSVSHIFADGVLVNACVLYMEILTFCIKVAYRRFLTVEKQDIMYKLLKPNDLLPGLWCVCVHKISIIGDCFN